MRIHPDKLRGNTFSRKNKTFFLKTKQQDTKKHRIILNIKKTGSLRDSLLEPGSILRN